MPTNSPLSLLLTAGAIFFSEPFWLVAAEQSGDAAAWPNVGGQSETSSGRPVQSPFELEESAELDATAQPLLHRLPPTEEMLSGEDEPTVLRPRGGFPNDGNRLPLSLRMSWIPSQDVKDQAAELSVNREELAVAFPISIAADGMWLAMSSVERLELAMSGVLVGSGLAVPHALWDIEVGAMHFRELGDGWRAGGMFRVGSPSDRPFEALRDMTVTMLGFLTVPSSEHDAWSFSLFYSPTGQIIFPIPGIAYNWRPNSQFEASLGVPFSLTYRPSDTLTFSASYRPLTDIRVLARQSVGEFWRIYGGYETVNATFLLADRINDRERIYIFDQRLPLGVQRKLGRGWNVDVSAAYVFNRQIFQADSFSGSRHGELAIDPGLAGSIQLSWSR